MLDLQDELMDWYRGQLDEAYMHEGTGVINTMRQWILNLDVKGIKYNNVRCSELCAELDALKKMASIEIVRY